MKRTLAVASTLALALVAGCASEPRSPEGRAVAFLSREVRLWPVRNKCFSCHNNGDAARALFAARRRSIPVDAASLEPTLRFLARPEAWKDNGPDGEFSDRKLSALQFAFALSAGFETGALRDGAALSRAAELIRDLQDPDGSWRVEAEGATGSPVTYGPVLLTVAARQVLTDAGRARFSASIGRAEEWLRARRPASVLDAAALLLARLDAGRLECLDVLRKGQTREGGWGPYVTSPAEVFDTALAVLALATLADQEGVPEMIRRGRNYLLEAQQPDGSWIETTRPPGVESYAHRISTSGWATLALLETTPAP